MTPPRDSRGRFVRRAAPGPLPRHLAGQARRAAGFHANMPHSLRTGNCSSVSSNISRRAGYQYSQN